MSIALVNEQSPSAAGSSVTLTWTPVVGNLLIFVATEITQATTLTDTYGNVWSSIIGGSSNGVGTYLQAYCSVLTATGAGMTITITNFGSSASACVAEFSGVSAVLDGSQVQGYSSSNTTTQSPGTITTTNANDLILVAFGGQNGYSGLSSGFTLLGTLNNGNHWGYVAYQITSSTGSFTPSITDTNGTWAAFVLALKATVSNFTVSVSPSSETVVQGSGTTYTVTVAAIGGYTGTVTPSVLGLPTGATATFSPTTITGGAGTSTMTISTTGSATVGTVTLNVSCTDGTLTHLVALPVLVINAAAVVGGLSGRWLSV